MIGSISRNPPPDRTQTISNRQFSKVQCHGSKLFGHSITHCSLLPLVLAVVQFQSNNKTQCETILQKHISQNSVSSKKTFVRALQQAQVLSEAEDSDDLMDDDLIINALQDNNINMDNSGQVSE